MKLAVATCEPRPGRLGPDFAEPRIVAPSVATNVADGGCSIQSWRASSGPIGQG